MKNLRWSATKKITFVTLCGSFFDVSLGIAKIAVGIQANGQSLVVDGFHSLSDFLGDLMVIALSHMSAKGPDEEHPYGHGKFETLGTVIVGAILVAVAGALAFHSVDRWIAKEYIQQITSLTVIVMISSLIIKEILFRVMRALAIEMKSPLIMASAWHSRSDALGSFTVLIGLMGPSLGIPWLELLAALIVSVMIGHIGVKFVWDAVKELTDTSVPADELEKIRLAVLKVPGVLGMHAMRSRSSKGDFFLDINVEVAPFLSVSEGHQIALWSMVAARETSDKIKDVIVHIDVGDDHPHESEEAEILPLRESFSVNLYRAIGRFLPVENLIKMSCHYGREDLLIELFFRQGSNPPQALHDYLNLQFKLPKVKTTKFLLWEMSTPKV